MSKKDSAPKKQVLITPSAKEGVLLTLTEDGQLGFLFSPSKTAAESRGSLKCSPALQMLS